MNESFLLLNVMHGQQANGLVTPLDHETPAADVQGEPWYQIEQA
jgi:hypothetical protein